MIDDYVAKGKVYLIHRDFPLQGHMYSGLAARWANAAAKIGEFQTVEAALYDNQNSWEANGDIQKYISAAMPDADFKRMEALTRLRVAGSHIEVRRIESFGRDGAPLPVRLFHRE